MPALDEVEVAFAGVQGQRDLLAAGRLTAVELLGLCLRRIERLDGGLGAFRTLLPGPALGEAETADIALTAGDSRPLLGVPVAVKDNVPVAGVSAHHGTGSSQPVATADAELVRRLRAAGAVVVGTTRMPELALWPFTESLYDGATRNPWSPAHTPGGSSGGSAAAVAAGLVAVATASDGGGSIRIPAACCGVVGLKPTRGLVPLGDGGDAVEHWHGLSVAGALTRTAADAALVLGVLAGAPTSEQAAPGVLRIAWTERGAVRVPLAASVRRGLHEALGLLRTLGHDVRRGDPSYAGVQESFLVRYARGAADDLRDLAEPAATERRTRVVAGVGRQLPDRLLERARRQGAQAAARLGRLPGDADVLVLPVLPQPPARVGAMTGLATPVQAGRLTPFTVPWNVSGQPALSVPLGLAADGLPVAVQLVGRPGGEQVLLALAAQIEARTRFPDRRPPLDEPAG